MITPEELRKVAGEADALAVYNQIKPGNDFAGFCKEFIHHEDYRVARSALWGLTKATDAELSQLQPMLDEMIDVAISTENPSVKRLTLNLVERLELHEEDLRTDFLDFCLDHMVRIDEYPGTQTICMKLAQKMCSFYPELKQEFMRTVESMEIEYYKPAVRSLRSKILSNKRK